MKKITYLFAFFLTAAFSSIQAQNCQADFQYWTSGLTVQFMDSSFSTSGAHAYSWSFGDGGSSTMSNPGHTYNQAGTYPVLLMIQDSLCFDSIVKLVTVTNPNQANCIADFQYWTSGLTAQFMDSSFSSTGNHTYSWSFGDGGTSTQSNPGHTYNQAGTYSVRLMIQDSLCSDSIVKLVTVTNPNPPACTASFTVVKDSTSQFAVTLFNTSSTASSHQYSWDFGDGNFGQGRYPTHQYNSFGSYLVCLKITDTLLNCITTFCDTVGMDSLGNLKSASGFSLTVRNPIVVGVDENEVAEDISVYPNPAINKVSIDLTNLNEPSMVRIVDITGSVVFQDNNVYGGAIRELSVANFKDGLYFIYIQNGDNTQVKKLVKTK